MKKIETAIAALQKRSNRRNACSYSHRDPSQNAGAGTADHCCRTSKRWWKNFSSCDQNQRWKAWWAAFTSFDEELKGSDKIMSTFTADIDKIFASALQEPSVEGVILNPWNRTLMLNKNPYQHHPRQSCIASALSDNKSNVSREHLYFTEG